MFEDRKEYISVYISISCLFDGCGSRKLPQKLGDSKPKAQFACLWHEPQFSSLLARQSGAAALTSQTIIKIRTTELTHQKQSC